MKVFMYGFKGSNMNIWIDYFRRHYEYDVVIVVPNTEKKSKEASNVTMYPTSTFNASGRVLGRIAYWYRRLRILYILRRDKYDLFILHGLYNWSYARFLFDNVKARRKIVIIWNNINHKKICANKQTNSAQDITGVLEGADCIYCTWNPTRKSFIKSFPHLSKKTKTQSWGIRNDVLSLPLVVQDSLSSKIISTFVKGKVFMFWPRTVREGIRHDILLEAIELLSADIHMVSYLAMGQAKNTEWNNYIIKMIHDMNNPNIYAEYTKHIPIEDIVPLYHRADIIVNLADSDQLSACIAESLVHRTRLILSDIPAYRELLNLGFNVTLVDNKADIVALAIEKVVLSLGTENSNKIIESNRKLAISRTSVDDNLSRIFNIK